MLNFFSIEISNFIYIAIQKTENVDDICRENCCKYIQPKNNFQCVNDAQQFNSPRSYAVISSGTPSSFILGKKKVKRAADTLTRL